MEAIFGLLIIFWIGKLLFGKSPSKQQPRSDRESETIFDYPEGGYGLDDDPVMDELFFLDMMEEDD